MLPSSYMYITGRSSLPLSDSPSAFPNLYPTLVRVQVSEFLTPTPFCIPDPLLNASQSSEIS